MPPRGRSDTWHFVTWPRVLTSYSTCRASIHWASLPCHQGQEGRDVRAGSHALSTETRLAGTCWISRFKIRESLSNKSLGHFYKIKSSSQMSRPQTILRDRWVIFMNRKSCSSSVFFSRPCLCLAPHTLPIAPSTNLVSLQLCVVVVCSVTVRRDIWGGAVSRCVVRFLEWVPFPSFHDKYIVAKKNLTGVTTFF